MSQSPDAMQALAEFWAQAGAALQAQKAAMGASPSPVPVPSDAGLTEAGKAVADLWAAAARMSSTLSATMGTAGSSPGPAAEAARRAVPDPWNGFAAAGGPDPACAPVGEGAYSAGAVDAERQQARLTQAWLDMRRCTVEHNAVLLDAWLRAGGAYEAARAQAGERPPEGQAALALWATTANAVLMEAQRGEAFLQTQAAMLRAGSEVRLAQQALAERWCEQFGLPTRTEMDEVHRTVTELRREVRALRRQAQAGEAPQAGAAPQVGAVPQSGAAPQ